MTHPILEYVRETSIAYGLHSNIPACCVAEYVEDEVAGRGSIGALRDAEFGFPYPETGVETHYVPCRACYRALMAGTITPNELHVCDEDNAECMRLKGASMSAYRLAVSEGLIPIPIWDTEKNTITHMFLAPGTVLD